jgi:hypothetical protein
MYIVVYLCTSKYIYVQSSTSVYVLSFFSLMLNKISEKVVEYYCIDEEKKLVQ